MASSGKKKTTMAKLMRETKLRERRLDKQARKDARKQAPADNQDHPGMTTLPIDEPDGSPTEHTSLNPTDPAVSDAGADSEQSALST
jgi:hypothetical protein